MEKREFMISIVNAPDFDGGEPTELENMGYSALYELSKQVQDLMMERYGKMVQQMNEWRSYAKHLEQKEAS